jgi:pimeloyl-ACP methyl ester carboxylesterase
MLKKKRYLSILCIFTILALIYELKAKKQALLDFPPKGILVDIGGRNIHLDCRGTGSPIVIFESGFDTNGSLSWSRVHDEVATITRACAYDRAGMMWSDSRAIKSELMGKAIAGDLNETLLKAGESPPYVLVGHSFGGPYITIFTKYYNSSVAGLVFIDTSHPDQVEIFSEFQEPGINLIKYAVMDFFEPVWSYLGLSRFFAHQIDGRVPNQTLIDEQMIDAYSSSSGLALTKESQKYQQSLIEAGGLRDLGNKPLYVIGVLQNYESMSDDELNFYGIKRHLIPSLLRKDEDTHKDQASWSTNSELKILRSGDHYIQFEKPEVVINAIKSVIEKVRRNRKVLSEPLSQP